MEDTAFTEFVAGRGHDLLRFAHVLCQSREQAEDLLQDALAVAYVHWARVERTESPEAYVRRVMVNRHISLWRRHRNRVEPRAQLPDTPAPDGTEAGAARDEMYRLLRRLAPRQRAAVVLRYYADCSDAEIAEVLGCSAATVRSQISRALGTLRVLAEPSHLPLTERTTS